MPQPKYSYKAPAFPPIVACALHYTYFWMVPYWITQFIIYLCKERLIDNGVADQDWAFLFLWVVFAVISNFLAERSIKQTQCTACSPFWFFIIFDIVSVFMSFYFIFLASTILFFEFVTTIITIIIQVLLFIGTFISFCFVTKARKIRTN